MKSFSYFQPTEIRFGRGRISEVGTATAVYGKRCLIASVSDQVLTPLLERVKQSLHASGVEFSHFSEVIPNPTTDSVTAGATIAKEFRPDVVLGVGGGSSMDTAKAIAVEATHPGTSWDYLYHRDTQPTKETLPIIAVPTTSGTGSQVTAVAVVTNASLKIKSAICNSFVYPRICIVDPELMRTVPPHVTASTGFDVFCHAFESYLHPNASPYTDTLVREALCLVAKHLPMVIQDGSDIAAREVMAWADTLAGLCIANAGVTLPHGIGMTIGGQCPQVMHGEALAVTYPEFTRFTYPYAVKQFAGLGRILNPMLEKETDEIAAERCCQEIDAFLKEIGMWLDLRGLGVNEADVGVIADNSRMLPDYKNNPRIASRDEIYEMLTRSYIRA